MRHVPRGGTRSRHVPRHTSIRLDQVGQLESSKSAMYTLAPELSALITCHRAQKLRKCEANPAHDRGISVPLSLR